MTKYTKEHIEQLLSRFMDGTSILEEEDVLSHYFLSEKNIPDEWLPYRDMFRELEKMKNDDRNEKAISHAQNYSFSRYLKIAAVALLLIGLGTLLFSIFEEKPKVAVSEQPKATLDTVIQQTVAKPQLLTQTPPEPAKQKAKQKTVRQKGRKITKTVKDADVIRQLESENAQLKAQLEAAQKEIEQIREQIIITEMQARGFQAVYQEDGSIQFVRQNHRPASVEL